MQQSAKLQNLADFIKKNQKSAKFKNSQNFAKMYKKNTKKSRDLQNLQISAGLNHFNFPDEVNFYDFK